MREIKRTILCVMMGVSLITPVQAQTSRSELLSHMELATGNY